MSAKSRKHKRMSRAQAAIEVLDKVWLSAQDLPEYEIQGADCDRRSNVWVTVRFQVPDLDVDLWRDGEHRDQEKP
jgi:hypothetical protein